MSVEPHLEQKIAFSGLGLSHFGQFNVFTVDFYCLGHLKIIVISPVTRFYNEKPNSKSKILHLGSSMKALLVLYSYHHKNTEKIAIAMAKILDAQIIDPQQTNPRELEQYSLIGFGAGIDSGKHYKELLNFADILPQVKDKKAFIFSTSGIAEATKNHLKLREKLQSKGYMIVDEFNCRGFNTNSFLKYFGGINKGRPNAEDLKHAEEFAVNLQNKLTQT